MVVSGVTHFTEPGYHRGLVPSWLPARSALVAVSGLADVAAGVLVAAPATRRTGARATAALITTYLPAHLEPLRHRHTAQRAFDRPVGVAARVVVNLGYVAWAAAVARRATGRPRTGLTARRPPRGPAPAGGGRRRSARRPAAGPGLVGTGCETRQDY
jgi:uncharacterized membrane protein